MHSASSSHTPVTDAPLRVIKPSHISGFLNLKELLEYRDLLWFLTLRNIKAQYAESTLGIGWALLHPLLYTVIFTGIFGKLGNMNVGELPYFLFSLSAIIPWAYFSVTVTETSSALVANVSLLSKVSFPRVLLLISIAASKLLDLLIGLVFLLIIATALGHIPSWTALLLPLHVLSLIITSLGLGMIFSTMSVEYRDVRYALPYIIQVLIYLTPIIYPYSLIPENYRDLYALNPLVGVIEGFRSMFSSGQVQSFRAMIIGPISASICFITGGYYFRKKERFFADQI